MLKFFVCTVDEQEVVLLFLYKAQVALQCYLLCRNQKLFNYDTKLVILTFLMVLFTKSVLFWVI